MAGRMLYLLSMMEKKLALGCSHGFQRGLALDLMIYRLWGSIRFSEAIVNNPGMCFRIS